MEALLAEQEALRRKQRQQGQRLRNLVRNSRRQANRCASTSLHWPLTERMLRVILALFSLASHEAGVAVAYLESLRESRRWPLQSQDAMRRMVEDLFLQTPLEDFTALTDSRDSSDPAALSQAWKVYVQWQLKAWVIQRNKMQGVAPSTASVLQRGEQVRIQMPQRFRGPSRGDAQQALARSWAWRWRARWQGRLGRLRTRDVVTPEVRTQKARFCSQF
jgi:hypothetical protein